MPKKISPMERFLLSSFPTTSRYQLSEATEIAYNVYELLFIKQGIRWIHAVFGYSETN